VVGADPALRRVPGQLRAQPGEPVVGLLVQPVQDVVGPLGEVDHPRRHAARVQRDPVGVDRRHQQLRRHALGQHGERRVRGHQVAHPVDDDRRVRQVPGQHVVERGAHRGQRRVVPCGARVGGGEAGGEQQVVALAQRQLQRLGQPHHHRPPRRGPPALHEADVPLGRAGAHGELQLAQPAARPARPQLLRELHGRVLAVTAAPLDSPPGIAASTAARRRSRHDR
jgi:hypothetical protein